MSCPPKSLLWRVIEIAQMAEDAFSDALSSERVSRWSDQRAWSRSIRRAYSRKLRCDRIARRAWLRDRNPVGSASRRREGTRL